jgi:hypothetical protein
MASPEIPAVDTNSRVAESIVSGADANPERQLDRHLGRADHADISESAERHTVQAAQIPIGRLGGPRFSAIEFLRRLTNQRGGIKWRSAASQKPLYCATMKSTFCQ